MYLPKNKFFPLQLVISLFRTSIPILLPVIPTFKKQINLLSQGFIGISSVITLAVLLGSLTLVTASVLNRNPINLPGKAAIQCGPILCMDGAWFGPDDQAPHETCEQRADEACQGHGGPRVDTPPTPVQNTSICGVQSASACNGVPPNGRCKGFNGTCIKNTNTIGTDGKAICGCYADPTTKPSCGSGFSCVLKNIATLENMETKNVPGACPANRICAKTGATTNPPPPTPTPNTCSSPYSCIYQSVAVNMEISQFGRCQTGFVCAKPKIVPTQPPTSTPAPPLPTLTTQLGTCAGRPEMSYWCEGNISKFCVNQREDIDSNPCGSNNCVPTFQRCTTPQPTRIPPTPIPTRIPPTPIPTRTSCPSDYRCIDQSIAATQQMLTVSSPTSCNSDEVCAKLRPTPTPRTVQPSPRPVAPTPNPNITNPPVQTACISENGTFSRTANNPNIGCCANQGLNEIFLSYSYGYPFYQCRKLSYSTITPGITRAPNPPTAAPKNTPIPPIPATTPDLSCLREGLHLSNKSCCSGLIPSRVGIIINCKSPLSTDQIPPTSSAPPARNTPPASGFASLNNPTATLQAPGLPPREVIITNTPTRQIEPPSTTTLESSPVVRLTPIPYPLGDCFSPCDDATCSCPATCKNSTVTQGQSCQPKPTITPIPTPAVNQDLASRILIQSLKTSTTALISTFIKIPLIATPINSIINQIALPTPEKKTSQSISDVQTNPPLTKTQKKIVSIADNFYSTNISQAVEQDPSTTSLVQKVANKNCNKNDPNYVRCEAEKVAAEEIINSVEDTIDINKLYKAFLTQSQQEIQALNEVIQQCEQNQLTSCIESAYADLKQKYEEQANEPDSSTKRGLAKKLAAQQTLSNIEINKNVHKTLNNTENQRLANTVINDTLSGQADCSKISDPDGRRECNRENTLALRDSAAARGQLATKANIECDPVNPNYEICMGTKIAHQSLLFHVDEELTVQEFRRDYNDHYEYLSSNITDSEDDRTYFKNEIKAIAEKECDPTDPVSCGQKRAAQELLFEAELRHAANVFLSENQNTTDIAHLERIAFNPCEENDPICRGNQFAAQQLYASSQSSELYEDYVNTFICPDIERNRNEAKCRIERITIERRIKNTKESCLSTNSKQYCDILIAHLNQITPKNVENDLAASNTKQKTDAFIQQSQRIIAENGRTVLCQTLTTCMVFTPQYPDGRVVSYEEAQTILNQAGQRDLTERDLEYMQSGEPLTFRWTEDIFTYDNDGYLATINLDSCSNIAMTPEQLGICVENLVAAQPNRAMALLDEKYLNDPILAPNIDASSFILQCASKTTEEERRHCVRAAQGRNCTGLPIDYENQCNLNRDYPTHNSIDQTKRYTTILLVDAGRQEDITPLQAQAFTRALISSSISDDGRITSMGLNGTDISERTAVMEISVPVRLYGSQGNLGQKIGADIYADWIEVHGKQKADHYATNIMEWGGDTVGRTLDQMSLGFLAFEERFDVLNTANKLLTDPNGPPTIQVLWENIPKAISPFHPSTIDAFGNTAISQGFQFTANLLTAGAARTFGNEEIYQEKLSQANDNWENYSSRVHGLIDYSADPTTQISQQAAGILGVIVQDGAQTASAVMDGAFLFTGLNALSTAPARFFLEEYVVEDYVANNLTGPLGKFVGTIIADANQLTGEERETYIETFKNAGELAAEQIGDVSRLQAFIGSPTRITDPIFNNPVADSIKSRFNSLNLTINPIDPIRLDTTTLPATINTAPVVINSNSSIPFDAINSLESFNTRGDRLRLEEQAFETEIALLENQGIHPIEAAAIVRKQYEQSGKKDQIPFKYRNAPVSAPFTNSLTSALSLTSTLANRFGFTSLGNAANNVSRFILGEYQKPALTDQSIPSVDTTAPESTTLKPPSGFGSLTADNTSTSIPLSVTTSNRTTIQLSIPINNGVQQISMNSFKDSNGKTQISLDSNYQGDQIFITNPDGSRRIPLSRGTTVTVNNGDQLSFSQWADSIPIATINQTDTGTFVLNPSTQTIVSNTSPNTQQTDPNQSAQSVAQQQALQQDTVQQIGPNVITLPISDTSTATITTNTDGPVLNRGTAKSGEIRIIRNSEGETSQPVELGTGNYKLQPFDTVESNDGKVIAVVDRDNNILVIPPIDTQTLIDNSTVTPPVDSSLDPLALTKEEFIAARTDESLTPDQEALINQLETELGEASSAKNNGLATALAVRINSIILTRNKIAESEQILAIEQAIENGLHINPKVLLGYKNSSSELIQKEIKNLPLEIISNEQQIEVAETTNPNPTFISLLSSTFTNARSRITKMVSTLGTQFITRFTRINVDFYQAVQTQESQNPLTLENVTSTIESPDRDTPSDAIPNSELTGAIFNARQSSSYEDGLWRSAKAFNDRKRLSGTTDKRLNISQNADGTIQFYKSPVISTTQQWDETINAVSDIPSTIPFNNKVQLRGLYVILQDDSASSLFATFDVAQNILSPKRSSEAKHAMLAGKETSIAAGEFRIEITKKRPWYYFGSIYEYTLVEFDFNSGGYQSRAYQEKALKVLEVFEKSGISISQNARIQAENLHKKEELNPALPPAIQPIPNLPIGQEPSVPQQPSDEVDTEILNVNAVEIQDRTKISVGNPIPFTIQRADKYFAIFPPTNSDVRMFIGKNEIKNLSVQQINTFNPEINIYIEDITTRTVVSQYKILPKGQPNIYIVVPISIQNGANPEVTQTNAEVESEINVEPEPNQTIPKQVEQNIMSALNNLIAGFNLQVSEIYPEAQNSGLLLPAFVDSTLEQQAIEIIDAYENKIRTEGEATFNTRILKRLNDFGFTGEFISKHPRIQQALALKIDTLLKAASPPLSAPAATDGTFSLDLTDPKSYRPGDIISFENEYLINFEIENSEGTEIVRVNGFEQDNDTYLYTYIIDSDNKINVIIDGLPKQTNLLPENVFTPEFFQKKSNIVFERRFQNLTDDVLTEILTVSPQLSIDNIVDANYQLVQVPPDGKITLQIPQSNTPIIDNKKLSIEETLLQVDKTFFSLNNNRISRFLLNSTQIQRPIFLPVNKFRLGVLNPVKFINPFHVPSLVIRIPMIFVRNSYIKNYIRTIEQLNPNDFKDIAKDLKIENEEALTLNIYTSITNNLPQFAKESKALQQAARIRASLIAKTSIAVTNGVIIADNTIQSDVVKNKIPNSIVTRDWTVIEKIDPDLQSTVQQYVSIDHLLNTLEEGDSIDGFDNEKRNINVTKLNGQFIQTVNDIKINLNKIILVDEEGFYTYIGTANDPFTQVLRNKDLLIIKKDETTIPIVIQNSPDNEVSTTETTASQLKIQIDPLSQEEIAPFIEAFNTQTPQALIGQEFSLISAKNEFVIIVNDRGNLEQINITAQSAKNVLIDIKKMDTNKKGNSYELRKEIVRRSKGTINSYEAYTYPIEIPSGNDLDAFLDNQDNWLPERRELHERILEAEFAKAGELSKRLQDQNPTIYALRGNTAAGKTTATRNDPLFNKALDSDGELSGAINPDLYKKTLITIDVLDGKPVVNNTQVHEEGSMIARSLINQIVQSKQSLVIDKRMDKVKNINDLLDMASDNNMKVKILDVDVPITTSLVRVLGRRIDDASPPVPFQAISRGFEGIRTNRRVLFQKLIDNPIIEEYVLYALDESGTMRRVAQKTNGEFFVVDGATTLYQSLTNYQDVQAEIERAGNTIINDDVIQDITNNLSPSVKDLTRLALEQYFGLSLREAVDKHDQKVAAEPTQQEYINTAVNNLQVTSRTAQGIIDTSASDNKASLIESDLTGDTAAQIALSNFTTTIKSLYMNRNRKFTSAQELRSFVENTALNINKGITVEGVLFRKEDSDQYPYTLVSALEQEMAQFYDELFIKINDPNTNPAELAAWIEYRIDLTDHFFADGCSKTAKAISAWVLMRNGSPLPNYRSRDMYYSNAPVTRKGTDTTKEKEEYNRWTTYYKSLFTN